MKQGSFPGYGFVVRIFSGTMNPSDFLPADGQLRLPAYMPSLLSRGRFSPVPNRTFGTCRLLYTEGFFDGASKFFPSSMAFAYRIKARLPFTPMRRLFPSLESNKLIGKLFTMRQSLLNVTAYTFARPAFHGRYLYPPA